MAQGIQQQLSDQTSTAAGTITFTYTPSGAGGHQWDDIVVSVTAAGAASGAYSVSATRSDNSTVPLVSGTALGIGATTWSLSLGPHVVNGSAAAGSLATSPAFSKSIAWSATGGVAGTVRMTVWGVKLQGT